MSKNNKTEKELNAENMEQPAKDEVEVEDEQNQSTDQEQCENQKESDTPSKEEEELNTKYLRLAADFQNYKRRVEKEKSDIYANANEKIVTQLLDVIDNFERALEHTDSDMESFAEGMSLIFKQFKDVLGKCGVEVIPAEGEQFDPNFHHAVLTEGSGENESGKVTKVFQKGYMLNKKVIRPSMVEVAE
ncbi:MAG: nucleotide exchange factor GrpE [Anaerovoracaceae bacterium]